MKVKNGLEVLDFKGVFIEFNDEGVGMFISEDKNINFNEYEGCSENGEIKLNDGRIIKWGILYN